MKSEFSKEQIVKSKHFTPSEKDILNALLVENDKWYSLFEAREVINKFYGKKPIEEETVKEVKEAE